MRERVCADLRAYLCERVHVCMCMCLCVYASMCTCVCVFNCVRIIGFASSPAAASVRTNVFMCRYAFMCICVCVCVCYCVCALWFASSPAAPSGRGFFLGRPLFAPGLGGGLGGCCI